MTAPFAIVRIDHVVLRTADAPRLEAFYTTVLGCSLEKRQLKYGLVHLRAGSALIDIVQAPEAPGIPNVHQVNVEHVCLRIDPFDAEVIRRHLDAHGVAYGDIEDRFGADGRGPSIYLDDPDGNKIELKGPSG